MIGDTGSLLLEYISLLNYYNINTLLSESIAFHTTDIDEEH